MFKGKNSIIPRAFNQVLSLKDHLYPTRFSYNSFKIRDFNLKLARFAIGFRGPTIWNKFLTEGEKSYTNVDVFKNRIKEKTLNFYSFKFILIPVILFSYFIKRNIFVCFLF